MRAKQENATLEGHAKKALPEVRVGNERVSKASNLAGGFVACEEHGTAPLVWVRTVRPHTLRPCCRKCIEQHCQRTRAVVRPNYFADGTEMD